MMTAPRIMYSEGNARLEIAIRFLEARLTSGEMSIGQMTDSMLELALDTARRLVEIERETRRLLM